MREEDSEVLFSQIGRDYAYLAKRVGELEKKVQVIEDGRVRKKGETD